MITPGQLRAARGLLGWSQTDLAAKANVGRATIADFESGKRAPYARTLDVLRAALEAAGVEFWNGEQPGVRMNTRLIELRARNADLRLQIEQQKKRATAVVLDKIDQIAMEPYAAGMETEAMLIQGFENLRRRARVLIQSGISTESDFEGYI